MRRSGTFYDVSCFRNLPYLPAPRERPLFAFLTGPPGIGAAHRDDRHRLGALRSCASPSRVLHGDGGRAQPNGLPVPGRSNRRRPRVHECRHCRPRSRSRSGALCERLDPRRDRTSSVDRTSAARRVRGAAARRLCGSPEAESLRDPPCACIRPLTAERLHEPVPSP